MRLAIALAALLGWLALAAWAQQEPLAAEQAQVAGRMADVEQRLLELVRLADDPALAARLEGALEVSRSQFIVSDMQRAADLLDAGRHDEAAAVEQEVLAELRGLLDALAAGAGADAQGLRAAAASLEDLLARQEQATDLTRAAPEGARDELGRAAAAQGTVLADAQAALGALADGPGAGQLAAATDSMRAARAALGDVDREAALAAQQMASDRLRAARDEVLAALRAQAERERAEARGDVREILERVLAEQVAVRTEVESLLPALGEAAPSRATRLRLLGLAARERALLEPLAQVREALARFGPTVAWPEALGQVEAGVSRCGQLLEEGRASEGAALAHDVEQVLAALIEALSRVRAPTTPPEAQQPQQAAEPGQNALDMGEELTVMRALQGALNRQTARLAAAPGGELDARLADLAGRQAGLRDALLRLAELAQEAKP